LNAHNPPEPCSQVPEVDAGIQPGSHCLQRLGRVEALQLVGRHNLRQLGVNLASHAARGTSSSRRGTWHAVRLLLLHWRGHHATWRCTHHATWLLLLRHRGHAAWWCPPWHHAWLAGGQEALLGRRSAKPRLLLLLLAWHAWLAV
jgi:hypothetical protein